MIGWEGLYEVSNLGNVRSLVRQTPSGPQGGKTLKPGFDGYYLSIMLSGNGRRTKKRVHVLVLEAFKESRPAGLVACHGVNGPLDNSIGNVEWGTRSKNHGPDRVRDGTSNRGERCAAAKLTWTQVEEIRERAATRESQRSIGDRYGIDQSTVSSIVRGRTWVRD